MAIFDVQSMIRPFRHRNYALYSIGNGVSLVGTWMQRIGSGWLAWELTHSHGWVGTIAFAELFPALIVAPFAGAAADRWDRVKLLQACQTIALVLTLTVAVMVWTSTITIWWLLLLIGMLGFVVSFMQPARLAFVPQLVPRVDLGPALAMNSVIFNVARFVGPMIAGVLILTFDVGFLFLGNGISYALFSLVLLTLTLPPPDPNKPRHGGLWVQLAEGLRYTVQHTGIGYMFLLFIVVGLTARPISELLPGFADAVFEAGAGGLSALTSAIGAGAIFAGLWLSGRPQGFSYFRIALIAVVMTALTTIVFALTTSLWVALPVLVIYGFVLSIGGIAMQTSVQMSVEPSVAGRVLSFYGFIFRGTPAVGALIIGFAGERFGLHIPFVVGGVVLLGACLLIWRKRVEIRASLEPPDPLIRVTPAGGPPS